MIDFDSIDDWDPSLTDSLDPLVSKAVVERLAATAPNSIDDTRNLLFDLTDREAVIHAVLSWVQSETLAGYHGTRLIDAEVDSILSNGLLPLNASGRRERLERVLSPHERWTEVANKLDETLRAFEPGECAGRREGQVHLTLSRSGLTDGFNQYLTHGPDFDRHVAYALLGQDGLELLRDDGQPRVIKVAVPGSKGLDAANTYFSIDHLRVRGDVPNLVAEFLTSWSYRLAYPGFQCRTLQVDCGMIFKSIVPASWIVSVDTLQVD